MSIQGREGHSRRNSGLYLESLELEVRRRE
jgi:hypothetical protein